jgi:hypothetical protein
MIFSMRNMLIKCVFLDSSKTLRRYALERRPATMTTALIFMLRDNGTNAVPLCQRRIRSSLYPSSPCVLSGRV